MKDISQALHVGRRRQRTPQDCDPFRFVSRPTPGHPMRGRRSATLHDHLHILASDKRERRRHVANLAAARVGVMTTMGGVAPRLVKAVTHP